MPPALTFYGHFTNNFPISLVNQFIQVDPLRRSFIFLPGTLAGRSGFGGNSR